VNQTGQKFSWQLAVLKSDQVNAYVAPGGKVVFYTGIVNKLNLTDAEIAAVMGHEMVGAAAAQLGAQVGVGLPYSRSLESRADQGGLLLMARAGYNPQAAITLWEKMNKLDGAGGSSFLSTHPSNSQRIEAMRKNLPAAQAIYNKR